MQRNVLRSGLAGMALFWFVGCTTVPRDTVTQVCTLDALLAGRYDGQVACGELLRYGDTGIGTFDKLDGEMVVMDGTVYQVKVDGKVYRPDPALSTPFAAVVAFHADRSVTINQSMTMAQLENELNRLCPNTNGFYAIQVRGTFAHMRTRSVPAQHDPYPPLTEAVKAQAVFNMTNITGRIVGFRCPPFVKGINLPGYHLHFIADDLRSGGHVFDLLLQQGVIETDTCHQFALILPRDEAALGQVDLSRDRSRELEKVEK